MVPGSWRSTYEKSSLPIIGVGIRRTRSSPSSSAATARGEPGDPLVVDGDGIAADQLDLGLGSVRRRETLDEVIDPVEHALTGAVGHGPDGPEHAGRLRDHVARAAGLDLGDGDHRRIEGVDTAGDERLERLDDLARDRDRVEAVVRRGRVAPRPWITASMVSPDARMGPGRVPTTPAGYRAPPCRAKAADGAVPPS